MHTSTCSAAPRSAVWAGVPSASRPGADSIVSGNLDTRYDGGRAILLLHDGGIDRSQTVAALPKVIDALRSQGYTFVQLC